MLNYWLGHQYVREVMGLDPLEFEVELLEESKRKLAGFEGGIRISNVRRIAFYVFCQVYQIACARRRDGEKIMIDRNRMNDWSVKVAERCIEQLKGEWR